MGVRPGASPAGPALEKMMAGETDDEDRAGEPVGQILDEIQEGRLGPVNVFDYDDEGPGIGRRLDELADRPEGLLEGRRLLVAHPNDRAKPVHDRILVGLST